MQITLSLNLIIASLGLGISLTSLIQVWSSFQLEKKTKRYFVLLFALSALCAVFDLVGRVLEGRSGEAVPIMVTGAIFMESMISSMMMLWLSGFLLSSLGKKDWRRSRIFQMTLAFWVLYMLFLIYTQFSGAFYTVNAKGIYHRGRYYLVLLVPPAVMMFLNLLTLIRQRDQLHPRQRRMFFSFILVPLLAMLIQMKTYGVQMVLLAATAVGFGLFMYILGEQSKEYYRQEKENAQLKMDIMLSQIQPHFLCNSLGAIQQLCRHDADARAAIGKFSHYFRENVDALGKDVMIPFSSELEHTRIYLELEQLRFGDDLKVVYDIACENFMIPTLTLQPIAENAVRHGVRGTASGQGTVVITARETPEAYEVTVKDDGAGFDPLEEKKDGRSHVALDNVRQRLQVICGGALEIHSRPGEGTQVVIRILRKGTDV